MRAALGLIGEANLSRCCRDEGQAHDMATYIAVCSGRTRILFSLSHTYSHDNMVVARLISLSDPEEPKIPIYRGFLKRVCKGEGSLDNTFGLPWLKLPHRAILQAPVESCHSEP
jgi:hypothetical protein